MTHPYPRTAPTPTFPQRLAAAVAAAALLLCPAPAAAQPDSRPASDATAPPQGIEEITIIGKHQDIRRIPGSAHIIDAVDLERFRYSDIHQILRQAPGVNIREEEGYGLRPNIGIRGSVTERSERITLMEDGVLIAPAPYSAPAAYYFPTAGRMSGVEVLKGPAAVTQGPYTGSGALNLLSTPIPEQPQGAMKNEVGGDNAWRAHLWYGGANGPFSFLVETHHYGADGFKDIDKANEDTGFSKQDYLGKFRYEWETPGMRHSVQLKLQYAEEDSDQSYLGLTDADFSDDPDRRYAPSQLDNFGAEHEQRALTWNAKSESGLEWTVTAYRNDFERRWHKTEGYYRHDAPAAGAEAGDSLSRASWSSIIRAVNAGSADPARLDEYRSALAGENTPANQYIGLRGNNRKYFSEGVQLRGEWALQTGSAEHSLQVGARQHRDEEDRLQPERFYAMRDGILTETAEAAKLRRINANRIQTAEATALWVRDEITMGAWALTPGLRYEKVRQRREDWGRADNRAADPGVRSNRTEALLPGLGVTYSLRPERTMFAGVHKGFAPAGNQPGVKEEQSLNYETGVRFGDERSDWALNLTAFFNDYKNLLGECTASTGGHCQAGDLFNGGEVEALGVEVDGRLSLPHELQAGFSFTWTEAEFKTGFNSDLFGMVEDGDPLPYIPRTQGRIDLSWRGALHGRETDVQLAANYAENVCVSAGCGERTDTLFTVDLKAGLALHPQAQLYARATNLFDKRSVVARRPYGARPNQPRTFMLGVNLDF